MDLSFLLLTILSYFYSSTLSQGSEIHPGEGIADLLSDLTLWIVTLESSIKEEILFKIKSLHCIVRLSE